MAASRRLELISTVENKDVDNLARIAKQLFNDGTLKDTLLEFSKHQLEDFWDGVLSICMAVLLSEENDVESDKQLDKMCQILHCVTHLAVSTLKSLQQTYSGKDDKSTQVKLVVPQSLKEIAIIMHGVLPTLTNDRNSLKDDMCRLFETWWVWRLPGCEELMGNTIVYLLFKCTQTKSTKADVSRVKAVQKVLSAIELNSDSAAVVVSLLLQCTYHHQFVNTPMGITFLSYLFTLDVQFTEKLHQSIKNHLTSTPRQWHGKYGEIYFRAWQKTSGEHREKLELYCIQDFMYRAVHCKRGHENSVFNALYKILSFIHNEKTQRGVEAMLTKLYEPILWRSLLVTNSDVRVNAATLMFDVFPLQDPLLHNEQADVYLQRQFDLMHSLLSDPVAEVRLTAVKGVGKVLNLYWELIPAQVIQCLMTSLVQDLAYDCSTPAIREATIKLMNQLCTNHLCIPSLKTILPQLRNFIHDNSEKVRIATFDLLLTVKGLRAIKFWHIVPVEHILARLAIDSSPVCQRIMKLIHASFVPLDKPPATQVERSVTLIKSNINAAREFYCHLSEFLSLDEIVKYMVVLCRYVLEGSRQLQSGNNRSTESSEENSSRNNSSSGNYSVEQQPPHENAAASSRRTRKQRRTSKDASVPRAEEHDEDAAEGEQKESDGSTTDDFCGIVEALYLMMTAVLKQLSLPENRQMKEGLSKKLSIMVRELMAVSQDPNLDTALVALAGHLPAKALPLVSQNLLKSLKRGSRTGQVMDTTVIKSLVLWGKADSLLEMVKESFEKSLSRTQGQDPKPLGGSAKKQSRKKKTVGFITEPEDVIDVNLAIDLVLKSIEPAENRRILLTKHKVSLMSLVQAISPVMQHIRDFLTNNTTADTSVCDSSFWVKFYTLYLRLSAFICTQIGNVQGEKGEEHVCTEDPEGNAVYAEAKKAVHTAIGWITGCVVPTLLKTASQNTVKFELSVQLVEVTVKLCRNLLSTGMYDEALLDEMAQLCSNILACPTSHLLLNSSLACVYQFTQLRRHDQAEAAASKCHFDELVYNCVSKFMEMLIKRVQNDETLEQSEKDVEGNSVSQLVLKVNPGLHNIITELAGPGKPVALAEKMLTSVLSCIVSETAWSCKKNGFSKEGELPPLTTTLMALIMKKKLSMKKMFIKLLLEYIDSGKASDIYQICGILSVMASLRTGAADDLLILYQSTGHALANISGTGMDPEEQRDLRTQAEATLQKWMSI